mmetsp:Transcript_79542/g.178298  ORF Transcript_79542/g.178298 Transcript_79542/m.178298 type:complete len:212 (+) Transcript_79542:401-1036(+)
MMQTSSIESFLSTRATAMKGHGRPQGLEAAAKLSPARRSLRAAATSKTMSAMERATTKTASMVSARKLFTSPSLISPRSAPMHFQRLTSVLRRSGMSSACSTNFAEVGTEPPGGYNAWSSILRAMHGKYRPTAKSTEKAMASGTATKTTPPFPTQQISRGRCGGLESTRPALSPVDAGSPIPNEETVEQTQKMLKQVKPTSKRAAVRIVGS